MLAKKVFVTIVALVLALVLAAPAMADDNPFVAKKPPYKTAIAKYKLGGSTKGTEVLYVKGMDRANHNKSTTSFMGMSNTTETITITTPEKIINVDVTKGEASATGNMLTYMAQEYDKLSSADKARVRKNAEGMGQNMLKMMPGGDAKIKKGKYMGKDVDIVTVMGMTSYTWTKGQIPLKISGSVGPMDIDNTCTSLQTDVSLPADAFKVPAGIQVKWNDEADKLQRRMAKNWINNLKDPNFGKKGSASGMGGMGSLFEAAAQAQAEEDAAAAKRGSSAKPAAEPTDSGMDTDEMMNQGMKVLKGLFD